MTLHSWWGVGTYIVAITTVASVVAVTLMWLLPIGDPAVTWQYWKAVCTVLVIAPPFGLFGGWHLLRVTRLSEELADIVARDRLSGAATRDHFFEVLTKDNPRLGVTLMVDIDHFKQVNDTHGHIAGDAVIRAVAEQLQEVTRTDDIVCRFGGEEFVVFLSDADPAFAEHIADRIMAAVRAARLAWEGQSLHVTVSVGGARLRSLDDLEGAMSRADACLYKAKARGRDRWVMEWKEQSQTAA